jgi:hypothetical protein
MDENLSISGELDVRTQRAWVVATIDGREITWGELKDAFDRVADRTNWKLPIDATIRTTPSANDSAREVRLMREAIVFFTGSAPEFEVMRPYVMRVTAAGYYAAVGS